MIDYGRQDFDSCKCNFEARNRKEFGLGLKFTGTFCSFSKRLAEYNILGRWQGMEHGVKMLRRFDGANLHWASKNKGIWFTGKEGPKRALAGQIEQILFSYSGFERFIASGDNESIAFLASDLETGDSIDNTWTELCIKAPRDEAYVS